MSRAARAAAWLLAGALLASPAAAGAPSVSIENQEREIAEGVRSGRLGAEELIAKGDGLSHLEKLKLYYYSQELAPFFEDLEERLRDLARADPGDPAAVTAARDALAAEMRAARGRLWAAGRDEPEAEWRRGLVGLVFLDRQWRGRVWERGKREIRNPYDLVGLLDCLDAGLAGRLDCPPECCRHWAPADPP